MNRTMAVHHKRPYKSQDPQSVLVSSRTTVTVGPLRSSSYLVRIFMENMIRTSSLSFIIRFPCYAVAQVGRFPPIELLQLVL